jgi:TolB-like protein
MSPEQARGQSCDHRTDIFAFGAVLYEMTSGERAFAGTTPTDVVAAILKEDPPPLPRNVPPALDRIVRQCLEKRPEDRFSSAHDLALALQAVSGEGSSLSIPPRTEHPLRAWLAPHLTLVGSLAALLLAAAIASLVVWKPWRTKPPHVGTAAAVAPSLVALPCKVLGSPESAYLTDAVPSTISTLLGEVKGMETKVPPTSFEVEKVQGDLDKIAKAYGVQTFVLSTATAEGDHLIFNIQLADARTRKVRWSHQYQGSRENYVAMAREAAQGICEVMLPGVAPVGSIPGISSNSEAELAFQQGKYYASRHFNHLDRQDFNRALGAFQRASELEPKSAAAVVRLAGLYDTAADLGYMPRAQALAAWEAWAQKAFALDPTSGEVWGLRADLEAKKPKGDAETEIECALKAAQLAPRDPGAQRAFAMMGLGTGGSAALGVDAMQEGLRLDPLYFQGYSVLAATLAELGRNGDALQALDSQLALDPGSLWGLLTKVWVLVEAGRTQEASGLQARLEAGGPYGGVRDQFVANGRWLMSLALGDEREARASLKAIMNHFADPATIWNWLQWDIVWLLPSVNRRFGKDAALDLLILSTKRGATYPYDALMLRPDLKELREDPRAADVIKKTKAPFDLLMRILQDARARGECPKYIEKPMDDLLKQLGEQGAWR